MKIRVGFVSNSSSSSFCIMGVNLGYDYSDKIKPEAMEMLFKNEKFMESMQSRVNCDEQRDALETPFEITTVEELKTAIEAVGIPKCLDSNILEFDLTLDFAESEGDMGAGLDIQCLKGDETRNQFKHRVYEMVSKVFDIKEEDIGIHQWATCNY